MGFLAPIIGVATKKIIATLILGASSVFYQKKQQKKLQARAEQAKRDMEGYRLNFGDPAAVRSFLLASSIRTSGPVIYSYVQGSYLILVIPLSTQSVSWTTAKTMWIDGEQVTLDRDQTNGWWSPSSGKYSYPVTNGFWVSARILYNQWDSQIGNGLIGGVLNLPNLAAQWDNTHKCTGFSYAVVYLGYNQSLYQGLPDLSFEVIPSASSTTQTNMGTDLGNPATALYEYMITYLGESAGNIDLSSFQAARNRCDETVSGKKRYQIRQEFDTDETPQQIMDTILDSMNGDLIRSGAKWYLKNNYATPTIALTESDLVGPISMTTRRSYADAFNRVVGLYKSTAQDDQPQTYPPVVDSTAVTQDGETITYTLDLPQIPEPEQAQRVALIELKKNRLEIVLQIKSNARGIALRAGSTVSLTIDRYGWSSKPFVVVSHKTIISGEITCAMILQETSAAVYDDYSGTSIGSVAQTNLPRANEVPDITNLTVSEELYEFADVVGNRVILEWDYTYAFINNFEVEYKISSESDWISIGIAQGRYRQIDLDVIEATDYDFRVRAVNTLNYRSEWVTVEDFEVVGKTAEPNDVGTLASSRSNQGITLTWPEVVDLDVNQYLVRYGTTSQTWGDVAATEVRTGTSIFIPFFATGIRRYFVKAIDTTGNESINASTIDLVIDSPAAPTNFTIAIVDGQLEFNWTASEVSGNRVPIDFYRIVRTNEGPPFPLVIDSKTTLARTPLFAAGSIGFWVYAFDIAGNSGSVASDSFTINAPANVTGFSASKTDGGVLLTWDLNTVSSNYLPISEYEIRYGASFAAGTPVGKTKGNVIVADFYTSATRTFWIRAIDTYGNAGTAVSITFEIQNPGTPTAITTAKSDGGVVIKWTAPTVGANQLPITDYEIRYGVDWATGTLVGIAKTTTITHSFFSASERFYFIKARDIVGNETTTAGVQSFTIQNPATVTGETITINEEDALLSFNEVVPGANQLPISEYEIRVGATFESSSLVARQKGTQIKIPFFFVETPPSGTKTYWIRAFDIAGNVGIQASVPFVINNPSPPAGLVVQVIRNVVFLNWAEPSSTVPIRYYRVSRSESPSDIIYGDFDSTAYRIEEPVGGTFTYKVQAIDFVGNMSDVSSQTIVVDDPDGFELVTTFSDPNYNTVGAITGDDYHNDEDLAIILGANSTETVTEHFTDNGWTTSQAQIDAGYPFLIQPVSAGNWTYEGEFDMGAVLPVGSIVLTAARQILNGLDYTQFEPEISVKENSGDSWIVFSDVWSISTVNFRYIRIRIYFEITSPQQVINLAGEGITVRIQVAKKTEAGIVNALAADGSGTSYALTRTFVDISEVTATVNGSSPYFATVTWTDPNPTEIKVFVFDTSNNRVDATVSLQIRGV